MNFRALELRIIAGTVAGAATGIPLAALGFGAWAIIAQQLANTAAATALLWILSPWRPKWTFSLASVRSLGAFSANVFGQRLLYFAHRNVDNLLIGKYIGTAALGAYSLAYNVMLLPFSRIAGPIQQVMFPAFARMQHDRQWIAQAWARTTRAVAAVCAPALLGLIVVAPDFVDVVLGQKWHETVTLLQILAWVGLLQSLQTMNGDILQALGRAHTFFRLEILAFCATLLGFILGLHWGVVGVATSYAIATTILEPLLAFVTARVVGVGFWYVPRALVGVAAASLTMMAVVALTRLALVEVGLGSGLRLGVCILVGVIVYAAACLVAAPGVVADFKNLRRRGASPDGVALTAGAPPASM
jgi:O-antigen/teichoic acid export membrane protein